MTATETRTEAVNRIQGVVMDERAEEHVHTYFTTFTGRYFNVFPSGVPGDDPSVADKITSNDVLALSLLGVHTPGEVAVKLVGNARLAELLSDVPRDADLRSCEESLLTRGPLLEAWQFISRAGEGSDAANRWVSAGKL